MERITSLNNEAVRLFQTGQSQLAVQRLSELLSQIKVILSSSSQRESQIEQPLLSPSLLYVAEPLSALPPRCNFIYNKLFKISNEHAAKSGISSHVFTACVIYNLAMIHHHLGLLTSKNTDGGCHHDCAACLQKAESLYQMCLRILENLSPSAIGDASTMMNLYLLLKAVSYNNLAQLYMDQNGHEQQAKNCLMNLHHLVALLDEKGCITSECGDRIATSSSIIFSVEEYDGIIENILLLRPQTVAAAA